MPINNTEPASLELLLKHIRLRGIAVGTFELQRLQTVFSSAPSLTRAELRGLLCALLAKDNQQHRTISRLFEQLVPYERDESKSQTTQDRKSRPTDSQADTDFFNINDEEENLIPEQKKCLKSILKYFNTLTLGFLFILILGSIFLWANIKEKEKTKDLPKATISKDIPNVNQEIKAKQTNNLKLVKNITLWTPEIIAVEPIPFWKNSWPPMLLLLFSGSGFFWLLHKALSKKRKREPRRINIPKRGYSWIPALQNQADYQLLSSNARREMSWGISHYLTDQPLDKLDIQRTVDASAKTGMPNLHFQSSQREREVWLWQDRSSNNPNMVKLAKEICRTLQAVNIFIKVGYFHALPNKVKDEHGEVIWSSQHEFPENQPLVVVLIEYESLNRIGSLINDQTHATLKQLSHWQNLCFVDCSAQNKNLCRQIRPFELDCILPQEVSSWLAKQGGMQKTEVLECQPDNLHHWAIACALPDRPLIEDEIRTIHQALGFNCAWQYAQLGRYSRYSTNGFDFREQRTRLLNELANIALQNTQGKESCSEFFQTCIQFWLERYKEIDHISGKQETPTQPWKNTNRQYRNRMDIALLQLWQVDKIDIAAATLFDLHQSRHGKFSLHQEVELRLGQYTCLDWEETSNSENHIMLPHRWQDLKAQTQHQLMAAGFGGTPQNLGISWNKTTGILLGSLLGLALTSAYKTAYEILPVFKPLKAEFKPLLNSPKPDTKNIIKYSNKSHTKLLIGDRKTGVFETVENINPNENILIRWHKQAAQPAQIKLGQHTEMWRLGENSNPDRPVYPQPLLNGNNKLFDWSDLSIAIIGTSTANPKARELAATLLDSGTADQVILGKDWKKYQDKILLGIAKNLNIQWLYINTKKNKTREEAAQGKHAALFHTNAEELLNDMGKTRRFTAQELGGEVLRGTPILWGLKPSKEKLKQRKEELILQCVNNNIKALTSLKYKTFQIRIHASRGRLLACKTKETIKNLIGDPPVQNEVLQGEPMCEIQTAEKYNRARILSCIIQNNKPIMKAIVWGKGCEYGNSAEFTMKQQYKKSPSKEEIKKIRKGCEKQNQ